MTHNERPTGEADISAAFASYYAGTIRAHGPTVRGSTWDREDAALESYGKMLAVIRPSDAGRKPSLLDVGCGYGALLAFAQTQNVELDYCGIDIVPEMIQHARLSNPAGSYLVGDAMEQEFGRRFDYVVCNGVLTIKLTSSLLAMNRYCANLLRRMFALADVGMVFNIRTNQVNFMVDQSYYRSPIEILAFCLSELSSRVVINHDANNFIFTTYVYREDAV